MKLQQVKEFLEESFIHFKLISQTSN